MPFLEIACFSEESALAACDAGAHRIELCLNQEVGGTTPSSDLCGRVVKRARSRDIPVHIMIRPRGGGFVYTDEEYETMVAALKTLKEFASGFVIGVLTENATIDVKRTIQLVRTAHPLPCTFHRAFDEVLDKRRAIEDVIQTGCTAILSAGGTTDAFRGRSELADLQRLSQSRIILIVGGGLRANNAQTIRNAVQAEWYHSSALVEGSSIASRDEIRSIMAALA